MACMAPRILLRQKCREGKPVAAAAWFVLRSSRHRPGCGFVPLAHGQCVLFTVSGTTLLLRRRVLRSTARSKATCAIYRAMACSSVSEIIFKGGMPPG